MVRHEHWWQHEKSGLANHTAVVVSPVTKDTFPDCWPTATTPREVLQLMQETWEGNSTLFFSESVRLPLISNSSTLFKLADANWSSWNHSIMRFCIFSTELNAAEPSQFSSYRRSRITTQLKSGYTVLQITKCRLPRDFELIDYRNCPISTSTENYVIYYIHIIWNNFCILSRIS